MEERDKLKELKKQGLKINSAQPKEWYHQRKSKDPIGRFLKCSKSKKMIQVAEKWRIEFYIGASTRAYLILRNASLCQAHTSQTHACTRKPSVRAQNDPMWAQAKSKRLREPDLQRLKKSSFTHFRTLYSSCT